MSVGNLFRVKEANLNFLPKVALFRHLNLIQDEDCENFKYHIYAQFNHIKSTLKNEYAIIVEGKQGENHKHFTSFKSSSNHHCSITRAIKAFLVLFQENESFSYKTNLDLNLSFVIDDIHGADLYIREQNYFSTVNQLKEGFVPKNISEYKPCNILNYSKKILDYNRFF
jgi:hypothetical protein